MSAEIWMVLIVLGVFLGVSKTLGRYTEEELDQAARLALLKEEPAPPQDDIRRF